MSKQRHTKHAKPKKHSAANQRKAPVIELLDHDGFPIQDGDVIELLNHGEFPHASPNVVTIAQYAITDEPLLEWPAPIQKQVEKMYDQMHEDPASAIPELERLIQKYPHVPQFYNYLGVAYENLGEHEQSIFWLYECYRCYPDYLFAKTNLIHHYLSQKNLGEAEKILDGKFDLKQLYPHRDVFHFTEVVCFCGAVGKYFWLKGNWRRAELYYGILKKLDPDNYHTRWLQCRLHPFAYLFTSLFSWHIVDIILAALVYLFAIFIGLPLLILDIIWRNTVGRLVNKMLGN
ncbi:MAG: hypothetical protein LiPW30_773 [Parcubacteria group bacterium LiPW_30]|nr:MAG: hypothetical protein LiPW30_773 [Parcubacteria group bacterium LiPW_30]